MQAKSDRLAAVRRDGAKPSRRRSAGTRLPHAMRRAQILAKASEFFAEYGLTAQTRALAEVCGVSQRLLYSFFPSKSALIEEVYRSEIAGPFKSVWIAQLEDRSRPVADRLVTFYRDYYEGVLTRRWLRLFLYASLADVAMAPTYITAILSSMLETVVRESAAEPGLALPRDKAKTQEIGWVLHGAVSHLAIRRLIYGNTNPIAPGEVIRMQVQSFLAGLPAILPCTRAS